MIKITVNEVLYIVDTDFEIGKFVFYKTELRQRFQNPKTFDRIDYELSPEEIIEIFPEMIFLINMI